MEAEAWIINRDFFACGYRFLGHLNIAMFTYFSQIGYDYKYS